VIGKLSETQHEVSDDPEIPAKVSQYFPGSRHLFEPRFTAHLGHNQTYRLFVASRKAPHPLPRCHFSSYEKPPSWRVPTTVEAATSVVLEPTTLWSTARPTFACERNVDEFVAAESLRIQSRSAGCNKLIGSA
jgi:hypothetical protein